ncbi:MAG: hypothetical protein PVH88_12270 [Ignavibacteria bacterium]|jgi:hypothetical protein
MTFKKEQSCHTLPKTFSNFLKTSKKIIIVNGSNENKKRYEESVKKPFEVFIRDVINVFAIDDL